MMKNASRRGLSDLSAAVKFATPEEYSPGRNTDNTALALICFGFSEVCDQAAY
jgi:hypothetical protein